MGFRTIKNLFTPGQIVSRGSSQAEICLSSLRHCIGGGGKRRRMRNGGMVKTII